MNPLPLLKHPKLEQQEQPSDDVTPFDSSTEEEEALVALIAHRSTEVEHNKKKVAYYQNQLEISEKRLKDTQSQLARCRSRKSATTVPIPPRIKHEEQTDHISNYCSSGNAESVIHSRSKPQLLIPALNPKIHSKPPPPPQQTASSAGNTRPVVKRESPSPTVNRPQEKKRRIRIEPREHRDLIPSIRSSGSPCRISFQSGNHQSSQHKRKLRSLVLSPVDDRIFATSALDGVVNLWQVQVKGPSASLLSTTDCVSPKQRRWPEDITWHPDGDSLFAVYTADGGDSQISVMDLNLSGEKKVAFLPEKPHIKGIINSILFMPWVDLCFATGGSDHAVILWQDKDDSWKPKTIHRNQHSSAVMGIAGLQQKRVILSVGADKRIVGFDVTTGRPEFKYQIESKCMSVLPNPSDFNLFMVQTGTPSKQLRLFDIRLRQTEIHAFGWKQESSESQSALINQTWSPDGLYLSSGSADPMIHIFDIRYNGSTPSQSVQAHQKRVFKAIWHKSLPLLTSISSDLNIGLHKIN